MTYEIIRKNYERGLWNARQVQVAVQAGVITQEQADAIFAVKASSSETDDAQDN